MFYCDPCAAKHGWPHGPNIAASYGACEVCGKTGHCSDVPSSALPEEREHEKVCPLANDPGLHPSLCVCDYFDDGVDFDRSARPPQRYEEAR
jgi:hypothetical protein